MPRYDNEATTMRELELLKVIREQEDQIAKYKLGFCQENHRTERLEMELLDREECIYKLNKMVLKYEDERKRYEQMTNDLAIYTQRETIALQQKEIEELKKDVTTKKSRINNLEMALEFHGESIKKTA